jgi:hypothetical protein
MRERAEQLGGSLEAARHRTAAGACAPASPSSASPHEHPHVIADDQAVVRSGVRAILEDEPDLEVLVTPRTVSPRSRSPAAAAPMWS